MRKQRILWILTLLASICFFSPNLSFSASEQRLALLIGNGNYKHGGRLANPVNDVRAMKTALEGLGFMVFKYENCSQRDMKEAMDEFGSKLKGQDVGLFFYAGHGVQVSGYNYLIPIDANLSNEKKVEYDCVRADRILADMEHAGVRTSIVILDACRDNPFERSWRRGKEGSGLAFMNAPSGSLIAYSTAPGKTALDGSTGNSPYTSALLEHIGRPNITVLQMFQRVRSSVARASDDKQIPWESTSLKGDFYFAALGKTPDPVKVEKVPLPSGEGVSFDDLLKAGQEKKQAMERWSAWQAAREKEYAQVQEIDRNDYLTSEQKKAAWERFLSTVADNNPFSDKDDGLRAKAQERVTYWKGYKVASVPSTPKKASTARPSSNEIDRDGVYVAYSNGIVRDTSTGLEWKVGPDRDTNWDEAQSWVQSLGGDWRMPTMDELESIYDPRMKNQHGYHVTSEIDITNARVWGSAGWLKLSQFNFLVGAPVSEGHSGDGGDVNPKGYTARALAVRDAKDIEQRMTESVGDGTAKPKEIARDGRFIAYNNGTVLDTKTNLMWAAKDDGKGIIEYNVDDYIKAYHGGGYTDWRLPTMEELEMIYDRNRRNEHSYHVTTLLNITAGVVWGYQGWGNKWVFDFDRGSPSTGKIGDSWSRYGHLSLSARILPVRDAKAKTSAYQPK